MTFSSYHPFIACRPAATGFLAKTLTLATDPASSRIFSWDPKFHDFHDGRIVAAISTGKPFLEGRTS
jgi:hypothetical protein